MATACNINSQSIAAPAGSTLFDLAEQLGVRVPTSCHKQGKCRECLVEVTEGMELLSARAPEETHLGKSFRLACRCRVEAGSGAVACHTLRRNHMRVEEAGRIAAPAGAAPLQAAVTRQGDDRILLDGLEITRSRAPIHGLAIDIGTTTCVLRLLNLETGHTVAAASFENPQRFGGSNVMARIHYDTEHKDRLLQRTLLGYLTHTIEDFPVDPASILETVITGNATMRDLFFGLEVRTIGQQPFQSLTEIEFLEGARPTTALEVGAKKLGLPVHPRGRVYGLPLISGHVGADAAAGMLAVGMPEEDRMIAILDVGTNTEVIVGNKDGAVAASSPAGPAFEGGGVSCGMPALEGAIEKIVIHDDGRLDYRVIGDTAPEGICGSGLIDLLSELLRTKRMNHRGRFEDMASPFVIDADHDIALSEEDISELSLAKGANVAGLKLALDHAGLAPGNIEAFYLAGAFGRHLEPGAATRIGMIPEVDPARIHQVGNAAIEGASMALLSTERRRVLEELIRKTRHVRLESDPRFFDCFVDGCLFNPFET